MSVTLQTLEMTPEEFECCKDVVRRMAYFNWVDAGRPECGQLEFWLKAQREWIEQSYVPHRTFDGTRPPLNEQCAAGSAGTNELEPQAESNRMPGVGQHSIGRFVKQNSPFFQDRIHRR